MHTKKLKGTMLTLTQGQVNITNVEAICEVASGCHQVHSWRVHSFKTSDQTLDFSMHDHAVL